jgi:hypothetical protein
MALTVWGIPAVSPEIIWDLLTGGDHRLFTVNDREPTGIVRFQSGFEIINPVVAQ